MISLNIACAAFIALASSSALNASEHAENTAVDNASTSLIERHNASYSDQMTNLTTIVFDVNNQIWNSAVNQTENVTWTTYNSGSVNKTISCEQGKGLFFFVKQVTLTWVNNQPQVTGYEYIMQHDSRAVGWYNNVRSLSGYNTPFWIAYDRRANSSSYYSYLYWYGNPPFTYGGSAISIDYQRGVPIYSLSSSGSTTFTLSNLLSKLTFYVRSNLESIFNVSYKSAYDQGYSIGNQAGYSNGYQEGQEYGEGIGYNRGYTAGQESVTDATTAITTLFGAVASVPSSILNGLSTFTIWQVSIIAILITFLIIAIIVWVIKKFI